jgi:AcrR family transcriptional regulator
VRSYRLGKRQAAADRTYQQILSAARELVASGTSPSVGAVARRAGVSRITVYNRFGSRGGLLNSLVRLDPPAELDDGRPTDQLRRLLAESCGRWAAEPTLFRNLPSPPAAPGDTERRLAARLAESDELRPGCSIKEAEDVIATLTSFAVFDRLHRDGRRSPAAVAEILIRLAGGILAYHP